MTDHAHHPPVGSGAGAGAASSFEADMNVGMARMMEDPAGKSFTFAMADQVFRAPSASREAG